MKDMGLSFTFLVLSLFPYQRDAGLIECITINSLFFYLLKETVVSWYNFPQMLGRIHYNSSGPGAYVLEGY